MDDLLQKLRDGTLTDQEVDALYDRLDTALAELKEKDPERYLQLLTNAKEVSGKLLRALKA